MAICPFAVQQIIPESYSQGRITPTTLIYHRAVSSAESLRGYWTTPGVELESHFHIGEHGTLYQFMDTEVRADANMDANGFAISVESWDGGNTPDSMPWNAAQLATAKRLAAWVCETHGIKRAAAQTWNGGGIGGHNWFPYPWAGGPRGCPGTARNAQIRNDIIPYAAAGGGWRATVQEEDDVPFDANSGNVVFRFRNDDGVVEAGQFAELLGRGAKRAWEIKLAQAAQGAMLAQILAAVKDDLDADAVLTRVDAAVRTATEQTIKTVVLPALQDVLADSLDEDNSALADEILTKMGRHLTASTSQEPTR